MKKVIVGIIALIFSVSLFGQGKKITELPAVTSASDESLLMVRSGASGNTISQINIAQVFTNRTLLGTIILPASTSIGLVSSTEIGYIDGATSNLQDQIDDINDELVDTVTLASIAPLLVDTIPLVTFGAGLGFTADTACFNNGALIGSFYNEGSDTLVITQLMGVMKEGTGTETISVQISWHATFLSSSATSLNASALAITSLTTGTSDVSFANAKIPPNVFVWGILSGASANNKPTFLSVTLSGYKIPTY